MTCYSKLLVKSTYRAGVLAHLYAKSHTVRQKSHTSEKFLVNTPTHTLGRKTLRMAIIESRPETRCGTFWYDQEWFLIGKKSECRGGALAYDIRHSVVRCVFW